MGNGAVCSGKRLVASLLAAGLGAVLALARGAASASAAGATN
jgi:hypothetical protein